MVEVVYVVVVLLVAILVMMRVGVPMYLSTKYTRADTVTWLRFP